MDLGNDSIVIDVDSDLTEMQDNGFRLTFWVARKHGSRVSIRSIIKLLATNLRCNNTSDSPSIASLQVRVHNLLNISPLISRAEDARAENPQ